MPATSEKLTQFGTTPNIASGGRARIDPELFDANGETVNPNAISLSDGFFVASRNGDGTFDIQSLRTVAAPCTWTGQFLHSIQQDPAQVSQANVGSNGANPSPEPPLPILGDGGDILAGIWIVNSTSFIKYGTLADAISAAVAGDTILAGPGTYVWSGTVPASVSLTGTTGVAQNGALIVGNIELSAGSNIKNVMIMGLANATPVILYDQPNLSAVVNSCIILGAGGTGVGIELRNGGVLSVLESSFADGTGGTGACVRLSGTGEIFLRSIIFASTAPTAIQIDGGRLEAQGIRTQRGAGGLGATYTNGFLLNAGADLNVVGFDFAEGVVNAIRVAGENVSSVLLSGELAGSTWDLLVDNALTGVGSSFRFTAVKLREEQQSATAAWLQNCDFFGLNLDDGVEDDPGLDIQGLLSIGTSELPAESVFGEGNSTTRNMFVFSNDGGASWVDNTAAARSRLGSTFSLFQGTALNQAAYIGNSARMFNGVKTLITAGLVLGPGSIVWEFWDGGAWTAFNVMASFEGSAQYADSTFIRVQNEQVRFDNTILSSWTSTTVNGQAGFWVRVRVTSAITTVPTLERIKIGTNRAEINRNATYESFGTGEPLRAIWEGTPSVLSAPSGGANSPGTQNLTIGTVTYQQPRTSYSPSQDNNAGTMIALPDGVDTSRPALFMLAWAKPGINVGDVYWRLIVEQVRAGDGLGALPIATTTVDQIVPGAAGDEEVQKTTFSFPIQSLLPGDFLAFSLFRLGTDILDTQTAAAYALAMQIDAYFFGG